MDPVMGTHQRDVPVLCIPGIPHRKITPFLTIISGNLRDSKVEVKEEIKEEDDEDSVLKTLSEGHSVCMMEPPNDRNSLESCPCPLYSWDSTQEDHNYAKSDQSGNLRDSKAEVKEEIKEEDDEDGVMEESEVLTEHKDLYQDTKVETSSYRNPPERCPRPLYSRDSTEEGHTIPYHQSGIPRDNNIAVKEQYKEEDEEYGVTMQLSEGLKDLYKDNTMGPSSNRNPPERCPRPLYSWDSTQEGHTIPHHHQSGNLGDDNIIVKEEYKEEDEEYGVMTELSEGHKDLYKDIKMEPPNNRNPPDRGPRPLYSRDSTQEGHTIPHHHQ
ncbi:hypothetical protein AB205_0188610, partial [Aquarana catesbeiana]